MLPTFDILGVLLSWTGTRGLGQLGRPRLIDSRFFDCFGMVKKSHIFNLNLTPRGRAAHLDGISTHLTGDLWLFHLVFFYLAPRARKERRAQGL